ncbi:Uncharacterised protein [Bordetella pertussis]|nr:Uncharacterised protein [Bordetella pertussis]
MEGCSAQRARNCMAVTPPASHTIDCAASASAQPSGSSCCGRMRDHRWPRLNATAAPQAPTTATGSHTNAARSASNSSSRPSSCLSPMPGVSPRQISPAPARAIIQPLRKRSRRSGVRA